MEKYLSSVCETLNLGAIESEIVQIFGGKTNKMFKVVTTKKICN